VCESGDPETFLAAAARVLKKRNDVSFLWIGGGPLLEPLRARVRESGREDRIRFLGHQDDVLGLLNALDIFVLSSVSEGLSYSILEAMACGLPVVATDVGGNWELIRDGRGGCLVPPRNPQMLADELLKLISDRELREELGRRARRTAEKEFSLRKMIGRYQQMYLSGLRNVGHAAVLDEVSPA
jgi:glycosyltransferase involved in cell wall biosynthesis